MTPSTVTIPAGETTYQVHSYQDPELLTTEAVPGSAEAVAVLRALSPAGRRGYVVLCLSPDGPAWHREDGAYPNEASARRAARRLLGTRQREAA